MKNRIAVHHGMLADLADYLKKVAGSWNRQWENMKSYGRGCLAAQGPSSSMIAHLEDADIASTIET